MPENNSSRNQVLFWAPPDDFIQKDNEHNYPFWPPSFLSSLSHQVQKPFSLCSLLSLHTRLLSLTHLPSPFPFPILLFPLFFLSFWFTNIFLSIGRPFSDKHDSNWCACAKTCSWWHRAILFSLQGKGGCCHQSVQGWNLPGIARCYVRHRERADRSLSGKDTEAQMLLEYTNILLWGENAFPPQKNTCMLVRTPKTHAVCSAHARVTEKYRCTVVVFTWRWSLFGHGSLEFAAPCWN